MARRRRKSNSFWFYLLIVLNIAASGLAIYGLSGQWQIQEESRSTYGEIQQTILEHSEALIASASEPQPEEEYVSEGMEEEEADQEETMWFIQLNQPQYLAFGATLPPVQGKGETPDPQAQEETAGQAEPNPQAKIDGQATTQAAVAGQATAQATTAAGQAGEQATAAPVLAGVVSFPTPSPAAGSLAQGNTPIPELTEPPELGEAEEDTSEESMTAMMAASAEFPAAKATQAPTPEPTPVLTPSQTAIATTEPWMERAVQEDEVHYTVDFDYLTSLYEDTVAWLIQEDTIINYPVMQAENNDYYLDRLYNGTKNKNGTIFLDSGNSAEFIDANNYIYGHNTKTGDMFGSLENYKDQEYYDAHPSLTLLTPYSDFRIDIFASTMSLVEDETSWRVKQFKRKAEFDDYITELKENSFFKSDVTPEWGDQFLVLCTCTNIAHGERYVIYGRMRPIRYGTAESTGIAKMELDNKQSISGPRTVGSLGTLQLYAQNDPLWQSFRFETRGSSKKRSFGDGGNGPTAVAMAVANLMPKEELTRILGYAGATSGFTFCTHSVNQYYCNKLHAQYQMQSPEEYLRYLPVAIASFTTGNNIWETVSRTAHKGGTSMTFLPYIAGIYGLELRPTMALSEAVLELQQGAMVVCLTGGTKSPFTRGNQYVVLAGTDDHYLYILDPYFRDAYSRDSRRVLQQLAPGAVRVSLSEADAIGLNSFYVLRRP